MLIGIDASRANKPNKTGTEWYSYYLIEELKKIDNQNHYFLYSKEALSGDLGKLPPNFESKILPWLPRYIWTQLRLSFEMIKKSPDVLFVPAHVIPFIHPKKTVTTCHDIGFEEFPELYSPLELYYHRFGMRLAVRQAAKIIVPSEFTKQEMVRRYNADPAKFKVIYHGYNKDRYKVIENGVAAENVLKNFKIDKPFILYIGRLEKKKNISRLVDAFHKLVAEFKDLKLVLVGDHCFGFEEMKEEIAKYGLKDKIIMPGWIGIENLPYMLNAAELFVFPSLYEGFGLPVLEAMACGAPVAASRVTSIPEVGGEAIEYFDPRNVNDMADKIKKVLIDKDWHAELRKRGLERVKQFSWDKCARETLEVLNTVGECPAPPSEGGAPT